MTSIHQLCGTSKRATEKHWQSMRKDLVMTKRRFKDGSQLCLRHLICRDGILNSVGLEPRIQEVISLLDVNSNKRVKMVGIYGIPGLGKTTIARAIYNLIADNFEGACFLGDIRFNACKHGLAHLQETLLSELVGEKNIKLCDINQGIPIIKRRLCTKKVLLILDNVDKLEQLQATIGEHDWLGSGSTVIVTTRDKHLLTLHGVTRQYEVELMNHKEALELLCCNAFKSNQVSSIYKDVSNSVVHYCKGLPIALEILGSNFFGRSLDEWNSALHTYRRTPNKNVQEILRASYDALDEKEKEIFLDIACFFKGHLLKDVKNILSDCHGFQPNYSISRLIEKSLIKEWDIVIMHDLIEEMGKEIVRQQSSLEPSKRSRLWFDEDIIHVLEEDTGTDEIEIIVLDLPKIKEVQWNGKAFKKMKNLKMLTIRNAHFSIAPKYLPNSLAVLDWPEYPSLSLPSNFHPDGLVKLNLSSSCFLSHVPLKNFKSMKEMNLSNCEFLERVPNVSGIPNLTKLNLSGCRKLIEIDNSVGFLSKLKLLDACACPKLRIFPNVIASTHLEDLNLWGCSSLESFPETFGILDTLENVCLKPIIGGFESNLSLAINMNLSCPCLICGSSMVSKIEKLMKRYHRQRKFQGQDQERMNSLVSSNLRSLSVKDCSLIDEYLSAWPGFFPNFRELDFCCSNVTDEHLVKGLPLFPHLELLDLSHTCITIIPECIKECRFLTSLDLTGCDLLEEIRGVPLNIKTLSAKGCTSLSAQSASILLSETLHQHGGTHFTLPGVVGIPEWFDHSCCGSSLSFWFRNKIPKITLCFVNHDTRDLLFRVLINGMQQALPIFDKYKILPACHISLSNFEGKYLLANEWNYVEIQTYFTKESCQDEPGRPTDIGVYIHKKQTSTEDVQFTNPNLPERRYPELRKRKRPEK